MKGRNERGRREEGEGRRDGVGERGRERAEKGEGDYKQ